MLAIPGHSIFIILIWSWLLLMKLAFTRLILGGMSVFIFMCSLISLFPPVQINQWIWPPNGECEIRLVLPLQCFVWATMSVSLPWCHTQYTQSPTGNLILTRPSFQVDNLLCLEPVQGACVQGRPYQRPSGSAEALWTHFSFQFFIPENGCPVFTLFSAF